MDKIITFRPYKVFDNGEDKFIFNIDTTAIYKVDDKVVTVNEKTPWMTDKSRTVVNPTLLRNDLLSTIYVKAYLRLFDEKSQMHLDKLYTFEGSLTEYKRNKDKDIRS